MNQKELIKKINKFCDHFDDAYSLNCGGCCYVAAVIAEMLEFKNIKYKVRYYDCPTHYVIEVNRTPLNLGGFDGNYDDPNTEQIETVEQFVAKKIPIYNRLSKTLTQDQADVKDRLSGFVEIIVNYHKAKLKLGVLREGLNYINSLILSFESFYNTFEAKISMIERRMNEISKRYQNCAGKTTRYICASSKCMNTLSDKIPYTGSAIRIVPFSSFAFKSLFGRKYAYPL